VAVAGGGLGGLCLAQGLLKSGVDVTVYERDAQLAARRQGYRLHVDARAGRALEQCLPPESFAVFQATCGDASTRLTVLSKRLHILSEQRLSEQRLSEQSSAGSAADPYAAATLSTSVNRHTLREVLATGLDGNLVFGSELVRYDAGQDGVRLHFADGRQAEADLLVGADGVSSAVRRQYLPAAEAADTGKRCIYGKTLLRADVADRLPSALQAGFTAVIGDRIGMATGLVRFRERPELAGFGLSPAGDYLMWALAADRRHFGVPDERLTAMAPAELHALAARLTRTWHPDLRALLAEAAIDETFLVRIRTSLPVPAWPPSRVTVLGDAIHAMSPARGSGANTALQDAALLCRTLTGAAANAAAGNAAAGNAAAGNARPTGKGSDLLTAVGDYEEQMREYGYAAVAASSQAEAEAGLRRNRLMFWLYRRVTGRPPD
jgi:2-polyprenyl-6-methoxyphenol hydroxylase-like FAD-dependent oxidoreductase